MSSDFDPYYKWLGIPPKDQPPHHYRLLGIEQYEDDPDVIEAAANRLMAYLHEISSGDMADQAQKLLNEISTARICLLNEQRRAAYDAKLRSQKAASAIRVKPVVRAPSSRSHPSVPRVLTVEPRKSAGASHKRSLWLIACAALLAFSAVVVTLLVVLNYDRRGGDPAQADANESESAPPVSRPAILELDWPVAERDGGEVLINGISQPLSSEAALEFPVRAGVNTVTLTRPGYVDFEETYPFARGERIKISPRWVPTDDPTTGESKVDDRVDKDESMAEKEVARAVDVDVDQEPVMKSPPSDPETVVERTEVVEEETPNPLAAPPTTLPLSPFEAGERLEVIELLAVPTSMDIELRLIGGESVLGNSEAFQLTQEPLEEFRNGWVVQHIDRVSKRTPIARFALSSDYLHFFWHPDCAISQADLLRNCVLSISLGGRQAELPLRDPVRANAIPLGGPRGYGKQTLAIGTLPHVGLLRLAVIRSDGPSVFSTEFEGKAVAAGESLSVDLGAADDGLPLLVRLSFTAARVGARKIVLNYLTHYQSSTGAMVQFERRNVQQDLQLARQPRNEGLGEQAREMLERRVLYYEALDKLTRFEEGEIRLQFRIFAEVGGQQVNLLIADLDPR